MSDSEVNIRLAIEMVCMLLQGANVKTVAAATGVTQPTIRRWRTQGVNRPGLYTFINLAAYFEVSVSIRDLRELTRNRRRLYAVAES